MENKFKLRISRMLRSSFGSCRSRNLTTDVIETHRNFLPIEPPSPKLRPFPSICRPKCTEKTQTYDSLRRQKVSDRFSLFGSAVTDGRRCPPASPISPSNGFCSFQDLNKKPKQTKKNRSKNKKDRKRANHPFTFSSMDTNNGWFSSDDDCFEDETETLFSSKSLSSDSSASTRRKRRISRSKNRRGRAAGKNLEVGATPLEGKVRDSVAVVKRSSDPFNDFRTSMVEMIIEKQIFSAKDLEQLLQCFISLNSPHHHKVILEVFTEICEALFSNWS